MATTAFGLSDFTNALEKVIQPYIQDNVPSQAKLLQVIKTNDNVQFFNNNFYAPIRSGRQGGVVNLANDKAKLRTGSAPTLQASVSPVYLTGTFDISDVVMKASANDRGAVESAMNFQMKTLKTDFSKSINRQYMSDGVGVVAEVSGSVSGTAFTVKYPDSSLDDGRGDAGGWNGPINYDIKPTKWLAAGQGIGLGTAGGVIGAAGVTISSVTGGTALGTVFTVGTIASAANNAVFILDGDNDAAGTSDITGVRGALSVGTANYAGISRGVDMWNPQYSGTAANAALSINDMEVVYMSAYEYAQEGDRYAWFMNRSLYTKYGDLLTALRRTVDKTELVSGWSGLSFEAGMGEVGVFLDFDTPDGDAVLLNLDTWTVCQVADMGFVEDNALRRADYVTFQKVFSWYTNLLCVAPAANGRLLRRTK